MSTLVIQNTNRLLDDASPLLQLVQRPRINQLQRATEVDWHNNLIIRCDAELREFLLMRKLARPRKDHRLKFQSPGRALLGKILLGLDQKLKKGLQVQGRYVLNTLLASGKNSVAYTALDRRLGRTVVLKFLRPGRGEGIVKNIAKLGRVKGDPVLVNPLDVLQYSIDGGHHRIAEVDVIVYPFVEGVTLREYLASERNSSPVVIQAFIEQTCIALQALEAEGLCHGDLHPNNILVTTEPDGRAAFRIIDVSYGADKPSFYEVPATDFEGLRFILRLAIDDIQSRLDRMSLRRHLGARLFTLVEYILTAENLTIEDVHREIQTGTRFTEFIDRKQAFLRRKFRPPHDFGILRYEELSDPSVAMELFFPYPELFDRLREFGSAALFGHRGTGKSTYMAAMTFFPQVKEPRVDYRESFGILFSCRQGEFRKFSSRNLKPTSETKRLIKDILIKKIIRKTLSSLAEGIERKRLVPPKSVNSISNLLLPHIQHTEGIMISHQLSEVQSLKSTLLQAEINAIDRLFAGEAAPPQSKLLDEHSLGEFFLAVRTCFSELNRTRFSVLFDDAGEPNVPVEVQSIICDLMASTNSVYCVKLSAEKRTFELLTTDKKPIERVHDLRIYTISDYFSMGGGIPMERKDIEQYFRELVRIRLKVCGFKSEDIRDYLGMEATKSHALVAHLALHKRGDPLYGGWQTIWQIADRTTRHLLEMISAIFDEAGTTPGAEPAPIPYKIQSRQILRFSTDKLRGLMFLPGTVELSGPPKPLGKLLYDFAASFGRVSSFYLHRSAKAAEKGTKNFDERLAIELDDTLNLSTAARCVLDQLIRFAVLDDEKMATAFDDHTRKPLYIFNKVYCPALRIGIHRYNHWRLSSRRFEAFLLQPTAFVRTDQRLAKLLSPTTNDEPDFFK